MRVQSYSTVPCTVANNLGVGWASVKMCIGWRRLSPTPVLPQAGKYTQFSLANGRAEGGQWEGRLGWGKARGGQTCGWTKPGKWGGTSLVKQAVS